MEWNITANEKDARPTPDSERTFRLPVGRNALGSSLTNYVDGDTASEKLLEPIVELRRVRRGSGLPRRKSKKRGANTARRRSAAQVELAAMNSRNERYRGRDWTVIRSIMTTWVGTFEARLDDRLSGLEVRVLIEGSRGVNSLPTNSPS